MPSARRVDRQLVNVPVEDPGSQDEGSAPGRPDDWDSIVRSLGRLWVRAYLRAHAQEGPEPERDE